MVVQNFYSLLGLKPQATVLEIKAAYRSAVLLHHPDKLRSDETSSIDAFAHIQRAWEVRIITISEVCNKVLIISRFRELTKKRV